MKSPTFLEGVAVALAASAGGAVAFSALGALLPHGAALRVLVAVLGLGYALYLIARSRERTGRLSVVVAWVLAAAATWFASPPLALYLLVHLALVWLVRSLYYYSSVLTALADLGLGGLGLAAALWAGRESQSVFLSVWCFFLVQALFVAIPKTLRRDRTRRDAEPDTEDRFQRAHQAAEAALRKLASHR